MSKPITKVVLTSFRGAAKTFELDIDPQKDLTMLFGENGSGKSTILDAMDVVCNDTIGCLGDISVGQYPGKYLCTLGCLPGTLNAAVHSTAETWIGTLRRNQITVTGPAMRPRITILRRSRILALIQAQPSDRYKELQHFIDIGTVEQSENALQQKLRDVSRSIDTLIAAKDRMSSQLDNLWEAEHRPGPGQTATAWAQDRVNTGIAGLAARLARFNQVVGAIQTAVTANSSYLSRAAAVTGLEGDLLRVNDAITQAPSVNAATAVQLLESLDKAKTYIEAETSLDKCPTCLRPIGRDELLRIVNQAFSRLADLKTLTDRRNGIQKRLDTAAAQLVEAQGGLRTALRDAQNAVAVGDIPEVVALNIQWSSSTEAALDTPALSRICGLLDSVRLTLEEQRNAAQRDVNQFNSIKTWWDGITDANTKVAELDRIRQGLQRAFDIIHAKRVAFTQGILDAITQEANRLFQAIHPGEDIGLAELKMEEERRGSVSQAGSFHGHTDVPPQAVFSESHLDTLGFCVWLALAKRESPEGAILLIDDIFTSVDGPHLGRVIDLLATEAENFLQVIVATHYRLWWDRCQNAQGVQRVHLGQWSVGNGIAAQNMPLVSQQLRTLIGNPVLDRQAVSSKAGILLESILDDCAMLYECSLPRNKANLYTLGALINGCGKLFTRHNLSVLVNVNWNSAGQPEDWKPTPTRAAFDRVNALQFIRNQVGCHFNPPGMEIPDNDVREFGNATLDLVTALTCPQCGCLATKVNTGGTALRCSCSRQAIRMTPVTIP